MQITKLTFDVNLAACKDADPDLFFADEKGEEEYDKHKTKAALKICSSCPVVSDCFQFAFTENAIGVWGGTTTYERRLIFDRGMRDKDIVIPSGRTSNAKGIEAIAKANDERKVESGIKMATKLKLAIENHSDKADEITLRLAKKKIDTPGISLVELAEEFGLTKDQVSGRLRRFARR